MSIQTISPTDLASHLASGSPVELIDVRTPAEFQEVHVLGAKNVPLDRLDPEDFAADGDGELFVICKAGGRGKMACEKLIAAGCTRAVNVAGGTEACEQAGLAVNRGKAVMSLERQVRIAAGSIVFVASVLALTLHPYFGAVAAFVGAGLVFAGVTDTCGMGMVLARMPWNQVANSGDCCSA